MRALTLTCELRSYSRFRSMAETKTVLRINWWEGRRGGNGRIREI